MNSRHIILLCISLIIAACSNVQHDEKIVILNSKVFIDKDNHDYELCNDFILQDSEIKKYFLISENVSDYDFNAKAIIMPCGVSGQIYMEGKTYSYEITAAGAGYIFDEKGWPVKKYLCSNAVCCKEFPIMCTE